MEGYTPTPKQLCILDCCKSVVCEFVLAYPAYKHVSHSNG